MSHHRQVRTFIATIPDQAFTQRLVQASALLKDQAPLKDLRWIDPKNWHITLRFLGNLNPRQLVVLPAVLSKTLAGHQPSSIRFKCIHCFPSTSKPQVIAALFAPSSELLALARASELAARAIALTPEDRLFRPHISLARYSKRQPAYLPQAITFDSLPLAIDQVIIFSSELTSCGPIYKPLHKLPLTIS